MLAQHKRLDFRNLKTDAGNSSVQTPLSVQFSSAHLFVWNLHSYPCREVTFTTQLSEKQVSFFRNIPDESYWKVKLRGGYPWILLQKLHTTFTTSCTILILYYAIKVFSVFLGTYCKEFQQALLMFFCLASDITLSPWLKQQINRHPKECNSLAKPRKTQF